MTNPDELYIKERPWNGNRGEVRKVGISCSVPLQGSIGYEVEIKITDHRHRSSASCRVPRLHNHLLHSTSAAQ